MADKQIDHEGIDKYIRELPLDICQRLPENTETREARRLINIAADLAHQSLEKVKPE